MSDLDFTQIPTHVLQRNEEYETRLNAEIDTIYDRLNALTRGIASATGQGLTFNPVFTGTTGLPGPPQATKQLPKIVNNSTTDFVAGQVLSFDSDNVLALADATKTEFLRGMLIATANCPIGAELAWTTTGSQELIVEDGISPSFGDQACLSTVGGRVTNSPTATEKRQIIGVFVGELDEITGKAWVSLHIVLTPAISQSPA